MRTRPENSFSFFAAMAAAVLCASGALAAWSLGQKAASALLALASLAWGSGAALRNPQRPRSEEDAGFGFRLPASPLIGAGAFLLVAGEGLILFGKSSWGPTGYGICFVGALILLGTYLASVSGAVEFRVGGASGPRLLLGAVAMVYVAWACGIIYSASTENPVGPGRVYILFDDAMVSMRYAWNLAHGQGLVWNPGERIEGITNLLMTLIMAVGCLFLDKFHASAFVQVLGIGFLLGAAWQARRILTLSSGVKDGLRLQALGAMAFMAALAYYPLSYWSLLGMETGLLSLLLCSALALYLAAPSKTQILPPVLLGLAVLARPDTMAQAALVLAFRGLWLIKDRAWGVLLKETALFACFPLAATAFRYEYYGDVVPNTYYLKLTGLDRTIRLQAGWAYTRQLLPSLIPVLGLALLGLVLRFNMRKLLLGALVASELAYQTWVGGDAWLYWRFFCPYFPLLAVLAVEGAALALEMVAGALPRLGVEGVQRQWRLLAAAALLPVAVALAVADGAFAKELLMQENPMSVDYNRTNMHIGLSLKRTLKPGAKVGVTWAGVIPFFSGHIGVDFLGKCDKVIAHRDAGMIGFNGMATVPGHNKYDLHYSIEQLKPDYIQTHFWGGDDLLPYVEKNYVRRENNLFRIDSPYVNWEAFMDGLPRPALPKPELPKPRGPKSKR